jgi:formate-dependent nitrite reductase membrane component NrfD
MDFRGGIERIDARGGTRRFHGKPAMTHPSKHGNGYLHGQEAREARLQEIRKQAALTALQSPVRDGGSIPHASPETGYYGHPLLKRPQWSSEIPLYFFCGGAAGAAAIIASVAKLAGTDPRLIRDARYLAAVGGAISPALLISDLGMPSRFLNMFRVVKFQSPMSLGSWTLMAFSSSAGAAAFLAAWQRQRRGILKVLESTSGFISAVTGPIISTYTGVLLGATAIPVWNQNASILPLHFATSGMATAAALLELRGHESRALNTVGIITALGETAIGVSLEAQRSRALQPVKSGSAGWLARVGGILAGPVPLILRLLARGRDDNRNIRLRKIAAASAVAGSLATRFAWTRAGITSAQDTRLLLSARSNANAIGD